MKNLSLRFAALMTAMMMTMMTSAQQNDSLSTDTTMWFNQTQELSTDLEWATKGEYNNFRITKPRIIGSLGLQKDFNLHRLGSLTADLRCIDLFNTNKTDAIIFGYRDLTTYNPARRTFSLDLTWKFNEARSKYRGSGAGEKQKARM